MQYSNVWDRILDWFTMSMRFSMRVWAWWPWTIPVSDPWPWAWSQYCPWGGSAVWAAHVTWSPVSAPSTFMRLPAKLFPSDVARSVQWTPDKTWSCRLGRTLDLGTSRVCTPPPPVSKHSHAPSLELPTNIREIFTVPDQDLCVAVPI